MVISIVPVPTAVTLAKVGSVDWLMLLNLTKLSTFTRLPGNLSLELLTVLIPPEEPLMVAIPIWDATDWITSALKVFAVPTVPSFVANIDLTSEME